MFKIIEPDWDDSAAAPDDIKSCLEGMPWRELEKVRRMLEEYGLSGWDMTYILPADKALHDKIKGKEEKQRLRTRC